MTTFVIPKPINSPPPPYSGQDQIETPKGPTTVPVSVLRAAKLCDPHTSRYALGGVKFTVKDGCQYAVATDARTMLILTWPAEGELLETIVPADVCLDTPKIGEKAEVYYTSVTVKDGPRSVTVRGQPIEGRFPDWQSVVPPADEADRTYKVRRKDFLRLLGALGSVVSRDDDLEVSVTCPGNAAKPLVVSVVKDGLKACGLIAQAGNSTDITCGPQWRPGGKEGKP